VRGFCYNTRMITSEFKEVYKNLNPEQKRAVDAIEGPVLVVAGPGTGKTQVLTLRIANILLQTDTRPENILALTFTDAAAVNMRRRLVPLIGARAYRVRIETFHSFANNIIKTYPEFFPTIVGSGSITEVETTAIIEELVTTLPDISILRPWGDPLFYVHDIGFKIAELKREGLTPKEFETLITKEEATFKNRTDLYHEKGAHKGKMKSEHQKYERQIVKNKELGLLYGAYQKTLRERRLYGWSDMIMEVLRALETNTDLKLFLQEEHQYILVDEHQDTNNAQNKILEYLADFHQSPNIFIVGDEKQAIFRFQGASIENFLYIKKLYPDIVCIELARNYRSTQPILDAAHSLLPSNVPLESKQKEQQTKHIFTASCATPTSELHFVTKQIKSSLDKGIKALEIAVLYRNNAQAFGIADMLQKQDIKFTIESDEDLLGEPFVRKFLGLLEAVHKYGEDVYLVPILHLEEISLDPLHIYKLIKESARSGLSLYQIIGKDENTKNLSEMLKKFVKLARNKGLLEVMESVLRDSGILNSMLVQKNADAFLGIERLFEEGKRIALNRQGATLIDFMEYLHTLKKHKIFIKRPKHHIREAHVRLMTVHRAKGLEFEEVYIIHANESSFGESRMVEFLPLLPAVYKTEKAGNRLDDERRLFYVAITRAKKKVFISYATTDENGREILPSPFLSELRPDRVSQLDTTECEAELVTNPSILYGEHKSERGTELDKAFVTELFQNQPLSVSALNNYLSCPWKYFYRNLLRIPSIPERHQLYGTAMHAAVQDFFAAMKDRQVEVKFLLDSYLGHLGNSGLTNIELKEAQKRGGDALAGWYKWAKNSWQNPIIPEFSVITSLGSILLSGKLDKLEFLSDIRVVVTDFKTGKQKSRNEIEGRVRSQASRGGDMKRQLVFYKLLLELYDPNKFQMEKGIIEFLEPNESGNYKKEEFEITNEEVLELKKTIARVADEITNLKFWNQICDKKDCEYCGYRKLLK